VPPVRTTLLVLVVFLASAVEMVEALTIVLAVGVTRGWRSVIGGVTAATVALAAVVGALGPALVSVPLDALRLLIGGLLLVFGLQWLRKAILRASGLKERHDETLVFARERQQAQHVAGSGVDHVDWYGFTVAFKGVFLEGLEVAFIVVTVGSTQGHLGLAALGAAAAVMVVAGVGAVVHAPLSRVPENSLKFAVGVMLTGFGAFWGAEGAGVNWPGGEASVVGVIAFVLVVAVACVAALRRVATPASVASPTPEAIRP
jgi:uncharacterized membrane protein